MKKAIIVVLLFFIPGFAACSGSDITGWIPVSPPANESEIAAANRSLQEWEVYADEGRVGIWPYNPRENTIGDKPAFEITPSKEMRGRKFTYKVSDGWLIGFNAGEWGGSLWWFSPDGKEKYKISDDQIAGFIRKDDAIFAIEGLAHLGISRGKVIRINRDSKTGKYSSVIYVELHEAPYAAALDSDGGMVVVTTSALIRVADDGDITTIIEGAFWRGLYPNSVIIDSSQDAYIGMRRGVAKVSLQEANPKVDWLVPDPEK